MLYLFVEVAVAMRFVTLDRVHQLGCKLKTRERQYFRKNFNIRHEIHGLSRIRRPKDSISAASQMLRFTIVGEPWTSSGFGRGQTRLAQLLHSVVRLVVFGMLPTSFPHTMTRSRYH